MGKRQFKKLVVACEHAKPQKEKQLRRYEVAAVKKNDELRRLNQLRVAVEMEDQASVNDGDLRRLQRHAGLRKKKLRVYEAVESLLNSCLPEQYDSYTPDTNALVERTFGWRRLAVDVINAFSWI